MSWCGVSYSISIVFKASKLFLVGVVLDLDLDLFFLSLGPCPYLSGGEFFVVSLLGEVCRGLVIESTSVMEAFWFSLFFVCFSLFVAISMFVSFFGWWFIFSDCSYNRFHFLYQCLHFVYKLDNYLRFYGCFRFTHMIFFCW